MQIFPVCLSNCFDGEPWRGWIEADAPEYRIRIACRWIWLFAITLLSEFAFGFLKLNRDFQNCLIRFLKRTLGRLKLAIELASPLKLTFKMPSLPRRLPQGRLSHPCTLTRLLMQ
jgi:hypothetical protein